MTVLMAGTVIIAITVLKPIVIIVLMAKTIMIAMTISMSKMVTMAISSFLLLNKLKKTFSHLWQYKHTICREEACLENLYSCRSLTDDQAGETFRFKRTFSYGPKGL